MFYSNKSFLPRGEQEFNLSVMRVLIKAAFAVWSAILFIEGLRGLAWFRSGLKGRLVFTLFGSQFPAFISDLFVCSDIFDLSENSDTSTGKGKLLFEVKK